MEGLGGEFYYLDGFDELVNLILVNLFFVEWKMFFKLVWLINKLFELVCFFFFVLLLMVEWVVCKGFKLF